MVQEKDAAKKRVAARELSAQHRRDELERNTIRFRWAVNEHTPEYDFGDGWSRPIPAKNKIVSPYFETEVEAKAWMDGHEPDKGSTLGVVRHRLLRREWTEWVGY